MIECEFSEHKFKGDYGMLSARTQREYKIIHPLQADQENLSLRSGDGTIFEELADHSWMPVNGQLKGKLRYNYNCTHGGDIALQPLYELVNGDWFWINSGKPAPPAVHN